MFWFKPILFSGKICAAFWVQAH